MFVVLVESDGTRITVDVGKPGLAIRYCSRNRDRIFDLFGLGENGQFVYKPRVAAVKESDASREAER